MRVLVLEPDESSAAMLARTIAQLGHQPEIVQSVADWTTATAHNHWHLCTLRWEALGATPGPVWQAVAATAARRHAPILVVSSANGAAPLPTPDESAVWDLLRWPATAPEIQTRLRLLTSLVDERRLREQAEQAMTVSEIRLKAILDNAPLILFALDRSGVFTLSTGRGLHALGLRSGQVVGASVFEVYRDAPWILEQCRRTLAGSAGTARGGVSGRIYEARFLPLWEAESTPSGLVGIALDITDQVTMAEAVKTREQELRDLLQGSPDCVLVTQDQRIRFANHRVAATLGVPSATELIGQNPLDLVHPEDVSAAEERMNKVWASGVVAEPREIRFRHRDGQWIVLEVVSSRVHFDGKPAILGIGRDVSERRHMQARLMAADRLASVGLLAGGLAHEINNPLTWVLANLELALLELDRSELQPDHVRAQLEDARKGAERIRHAVRDLHAFSAGDQQAEPRPTDPIPCLEAALRLVGNELRHRARLVRDLQPTLRVLGQEAQLGQVMLSLLLNAVHAMPEGSVSKHTLTVRSRTTGGSFVEIEITDTGTGIDPRNLPLLFEPFFTTQPGGTGTGLGLYLSQRIVHSMGGTIEIDSVLDRGTTVRVRLPGMVEGAKAAPALPVKEVVAADQRARLLLIDDESLVLRVLQKTFADHDVQTVTRAREAIELLKNGQRFDLVLCDLMMPEMTGMELYTRVAEMAPPQAARFVFLSGGAFTEEAARFLRTTPCPRMEKPFRREELRQRVNDLLTEWGRITPA